MADEEYVTRIRELQRYVPFLEQTIKRLKSETGKHIEAQISKLQSLLDILTDTKKKIKYDALRKCEEVILKLCEKAEKKSPLETMHKYLCRNLPDDKVLFSSHDSSSNLDSEMPFSAAQQELNKQADMTPESPSSLLENTLAARPIAIPTEKVQNDRTVIFSDYNDNSDSPYSENWNAKQTINWPTSVIQNWTNEQLYFRRSELSPRQDIKNPKFNVWCHKESNITKNPASGRELIDYSDIFEVDFSRILEDPKPVPPPKIIVKQDRIIGENLEEQKKIQMLKSPSPPKLNKPPQSESNLRDILSCAPSSSESSPALVNEDMDLEKLEELKAKLGRELKESKEKEEHLKVSKTFPVLAPQKPKPKIVERVVKEQDIFGNLLSSIDQQIMSKKDQKKIKKKDVNTSKNIKKQDKSVNKTDIKEKKDNKYKEHDKSKDESNIKDRDTKIKDDSKNKDNDLKDKELKSKDLNKEKELKHKKHKENESKNKDDTKKEIKSKQLESKSRESSSKHSLKNKENSSDTSKVDKPRRISLQEKKVDPPEKLTDDYKISAASRMSDKYPHNRKPSIDKLDATKPEPSKDTPLTVEVHTTNLQDPRLRNPVFPPVLPVELKSPPFAQNLSKNFPNEPIINKPPSIGPFLGNRAPKDPLANDMELLPNSIGNRTSVDPFTSSMTIIGPLSTNYDVDMGQLPFQTNFNSQNDQFRPPVFFTPSQDQLRPQLNQTRPGMDQPLKPNLDQFQPNKDQFYSNPEPFRNNLDMFRPNLDQYRPGQDQIRPNQDQFKPNQDHFKPNQRPNLFRSNPDNFRPNFRHKKLDQFRRTEDKFRPTFNPRFSNQNPPSINRADFHQNQPQEQNFNPYDLSQMSPIDFYEDKDQNQERSFHENEEHNEKRIDDFPNLRLFRGSGKIGNYCPNRGRRDDSTDERSRVPNKNDRDDKDTKRSRFSKEKNDAERSRFEERNTSKEKSIEAKRKDLRKKIPKETKKEKPKTKTLKLSSVKSKEDISSPLDMIYSSVSKPIVGKGYGFQNFRIPKIRKSENKKEKTKDVKNETEEIRSIEDEPKVAEIIEEPKEKVKKDDAKKEKEKEVKTNSSAGPSKEVMENPKTEADEKLDMFNKFIKHIFDTSNTSFLLQYLNKRGISVPQTKTKRLRRINNSESEVKEISREEEKKEKVEEVKIGETSPPKEPEDKATKKAPTEEAEKPNEILESLGDRIKKRQRKHINYSYDSSPEKTLDINEASPRISKRNSSKSTMKIPKAKRKITLELLEDDMFISEGVLTTGKRMCRMMKEHEEQGLYNDLNDPKTKEKESITSEDDDNDLPLAKRKNKTAKKEEKKEIKAEKIKHPQKRFRSSPRVILQNLKFPTAISSDEERSVEEKEEKKDVETEIRVGVKRKRKPGPKRDDQRGRKKEKPLSAEPSSSLSIVDLETTETESIRSKTVEVQTGMETAESAFDNEENTQRRKLVEMKKNSWDHDVTKKNKCRIRKFDGSTSSLSQNTEISDQMSVAESINEETSVNENEDIDAELLLLSQNSVDDENALSINLKPDVNYFLDSSNRFDCKLCDYKGKFIVTHYRIRHPESENMISRLNPEQAEKAQIESRLNKFDEIEPYEETENGKKRKTTFVCRFCNDYIKNEVVETFFDHVACHTGEFRYSCEFCPFFASNINTLSAHYCNTHPEFEKPLILTPMWACPPNFRMMFGYLCKACNFTQLLKKNIEKHIKVSHFAQNIEIVKINLSSKPVPLEDLNTTELESKVGVEEIREETTKPIIKEKEPNMTGFVKPENLESNVRQQQQEMGFLQIKEVRTLTEEEEHVLELNSQKTPPKLIEVQKIIQPNVAVVQQNTTDATHKIIPTKKLMIPLEPIATSSTGNVISYKTKKIFNEMLTFPKILDLYKCPLEFCSFSTGAENEFKIHMTSHKWCQVTLCVYCREGISSNNLIKHIYTIHSHCSLQCALCFYRTISETYLIDHHKTVHKYNFVNLVKGFFHQIIPTNKTSFLYKIPPRSLMIYPYKCIQDKCTQKFLTSDDFMVHLHIFHKKYFMCAICDSQRAQFLTAQTLIQHYVIHNIARYQCQHCICGTLNMDAMFTHYATKHQHLEPICYVRQYKKGVLGSPKTIDDLIVINMDQKKTIKPVKTLPQTPDKIKTGQASSSTITTLRDDQNVSSSNKEKTVEETSEENNNIIVSVLKNDPETSKVISVDKNVETTKIVNIDEDTGPENLKNIDVIDLSDKNPHFNEPNEILKHRNIESKNAIDPSLVANFEKPNDITEIESKEVKDLCDYELYKCGTRNCTFRTSVLSDFKSHLFICDVMCSSFNCVHCDTKFSSVLDLCEHIQIHGEKRFTCGVCDYNSPLEQHIAKHMKDVHKTITTKLRPIVPLKKDMTKDHFMVESINKDKEIQKNIFEEQPQNYSELNPVPTFTNLFGPENMQNELGKRFTCEICEYHSCLEHDLDTHMKDIHQVTKTQFQPIDPQRRDLSGDHFHVKTILKKSLEPKEDDNKTKNIFGPEDIDSLPIEPVYSREIKCKLCNYNTKVRSNMQTHLQQHIDEKVVPETALVNPVTCLEKNEKMFDTNLAARSYSARMDGKAMEKSDTSNKEDNNIYPGFIPVSKRFVCGAKNCNYLTQDDQMLRHHLTVLHADEMIYKCPHCQIDFISDIDGLDIDYILFHLKLHDLHLYECPNCNFFHYQKHEIERHISNKHTDEEYKNIVVIRELDNSANHDNDNDDNFIGHFKKMHSDFDGSPKMETIYNKITEEDQELEQASSSFQDDTSEISSPLPQNFDTTPLGTNNETGIKYILGGLLEETPTSFSPRRTPKVIEKLQDKSNLGEGTSENVKDITETEETLEKSKTPMEETDVEIIIEEVMPSTSKLPCKSCGFGEKNIRTFQKRQRKQVFYSEIPRPQTGDITPESLKRKHPLVDENDEKKEENTEETEREATDVVNEIESIDDENKEIFFGCLHCRKKSAKLKKIHLHFFETHSQIKSGFKYKKIIVDKTKKLNYKCKYCDWNGDPTGLKHHCCKKHKNETWVPQRNTKLKCCFCAQICAKIDQIKKHFNVKHPNENLTFYTLLEDGTILDKTEFFELTGYVSNDEELKKFKCPVCGHSNNSYGPMKMHLRRHNRPFLCSHCNKKFFFPNHLKNHHDKTHGDLPLVINEPLEVKEQLEKVTETLLHLNDDGTYSTKNKLKRANNTDLDEPPNKVLLLDDNLETKTVNGT